MLKALVGKTDGFKKLVAKCSVSVILVASFSALVTAQSFEPIQNLSADPGFSNVPQIAVGGANVYVVWQDGSINSTGDILFRRSPDSGANWGAIQNFSIRPRDSFQPRLAANGNSVYVVWQEFTPDTGSYEVYLRRSTDGGSTFDPPVNLSAGVGSLSNPAFGVPDIAVAGSNIYIVWAHQLGGLSVFFRRSTDAGLTWSDIFQVTPAFGDNLVPRVVSSGDNVVVAWRRSPGSGPHDILVRQSADAGVDWSTAQNLSSGGLGAGNHDLVAEGSNVFVFWEDGNRSVLYRRSTDGGATFESALDLTGELTTDGLLIFPRAAIGDLKVYLTWNSGSSGNQQIFFRRSLNGGVSWDGIQSLSPQGVSASAPVAASANNVFVTWRGRLDTPGEFDIFFRNSTDNGTTWSPPLSSDPLNLSATSGDSRSPQLAVTGSSTFVVWEDFMPGNLDIFFRRAVESDVPLLGWPFIESIRWAITGFGTGDCNGVNGKTEGTHCGDDWYAQDWNWRSGNDDLGKVLLSATTGRVIFSGPEEHSLKKGYGNEVVIQLSPPFENFALRYTHLHEVLVATGDEVCIGSPVGVLGSTGAVTGPHLHAAFYQNINEVSAKNGTGNSGLFWLEQGKSPESVLQGTPVTNFAAPFTFDPTITGSGCEGEGFVVAGRVIMGEGEAVDKVTLKLSGPISMETLPVVTKERGKVGGGNYAFRGLSNGTHTVTPERRGYIFDPPSQIVEIAGGHVSGVCFVAVPLRAR